MSKGVAKLAHYEKTIDSKVIYEGKILTLRRDTVELENGNHAAREVIDHPGGVAVLAIDEHEHILFVSQFRYPFGGVMLELPAASWSAGRTRRNAACANYRRNADARRTVLYRLRGCIQLVLTIRKSYIFF